MTDGIPKDSGEDAEYITKDLFEGYRQMLVLMFFATAAVVVVSVIVALCIHFKPLNELSPNDI